MPFLGWIQAKNIWLAVPNPPTGFKSAPTRARMLPWAPEERSPVSVTLMQANSLATSNDWNSPEDAQKSTHNEPNHAHPWLDSLITKHKPHEAGHGEAASPQSST